MVNVKKTEAAVRLSRPNLERCWGLRVEGPLALHQHNQRQNSAHDCFLLGRQKKKKNAVLIA